MSTAIMTTATIPMTKQDVFTKVVKHLRQQGKRAATEGGDCRYRTDDGLKCAAGCLIADEHYHPALEGKSASGMPVSSALASSGVPYIAMDMLREMQLVHDSEELSDWESKFAQVAADHGLEVPT